MNAGPDRGRSDRGVAPEAQALRVGFGRADITPDVANGPVWIAGYGHNRRATGVHDPLWARAVVLREGDGTTIALVAVDLIGLQYPSTLRVRERLPGFGYVLIASTHNHEGPDVIGLWGPSPRESGVDPAHVARVEAQVVAAVRQAEAALAPVEAWYGTAEDDSLLHDSRLPIVKDGVLRALRFAPVGHRDRTAGLLVQWNCHPANLGGRNTLITADFPQATIRALEASYRCPVAYFTGAIGGLMSAPVGKFRGTDGEYLRDGDYEFARVYGEAVADLAARALDGARPLDLVPFRIAARPVIIPLGNPRFSQGRAVGVFRRPAYTWRGDPDRLGPPLPDDQSEGTLGVLTEVGCLRLGDLRIAAVPGELYPELAYGAIQDPADPNADFPDAPLEPPVFSRSNAEKAMLFGLANDEIGYIIPKRQWDAEPPYAYGRDQPQYGEGNSVGPEAAPIVMGALQARVREIEGH